MFGKQFALLAIFCLVQGLYGETVHDVMEEYRPKVRELGMKIGMSAKEVGKNMAAMNAKMEENMGHGWNMVHDKMMAMKMMVDEAMKEAEAHGKDITHCVSKIHEEMHAMDMDAMKKCYPQEEMMMVKKAMESMNRMQGLVNKIPSDCAKQFPWDTQTAELRKCMDDAMDKMEKEMMHHMMEAQMNLDNAWKMNEKCVNNTMKAMMRMMDNMTKNFKKCVNMA